MLKTMVREDPLERALKIAVASHASPFFRDWEQYHICRDKLLASNITTLS